MKKLLIPLFLLSGSAIFCMQNMQMADKQKKMAGMMSKHKQEMQTMMTKHAEDMKAVMEKHKKMMDDCCKMMT